MKTKHAYTILFILMLYTANTLGQNFDLQGHRGCRGLLPENSVAAMLHAIDLGVNTLEFDVIVSGDEQIVVSHEPYLSAEICLDKNGNTIEPNSEKSFNLYKMPYSDIRQYDCGSKPHPRFLQQKNQPTYKPLLSELLEKTEAYIRQKYPQKTIFYNIEIKSTPETDDIFHPQPAHFAELLMGVIEAQDINTRVCIQSFDVRPLQYLHKKYPNITLALLVENKASVQQNLTLLGFTPAVYSPHYALLNAQAVRFLHQKGIKIVPWTVNETADMKRLIELGVDGLISDYPNRYFELIGNEPTNKMPLKVVCEGPNDNTFAILPIDNNDKNTYRVMFNSPAGYGKAHIETTASEKDLECVWNLDKLEGFSLHIGTQQYAFFEHEGTMRPTTQLPNEQTTTLLSLISLQISPIDNTNDKKGNFATMFAQKNNYILKIPKLFLEKYPAFSVQWIDFYR